MSLEKNIFGIVSKGYVNFSAQTNFDEGKGPYNVDFVPKPKKDEPPVMATKPTSERIKEDATKRFKGTVAKKEVAAPAKAVVDSELEKFNKQRQAAIENQGKQALANISGESGSPKSTKAKATPAPANPTATSQDRFLAEKGTKAKATPKGIPFDPEKFKESTGITKNAAGKTIKTYTDSEGNVFIRGQYGMEKLRSADGTINKRFLTLNKNYEVGAVGAGSAVASREKTSEGTTTVAKPTADVAPIQTALKGEDFQKAYEAKKKAVPNDKIKR